jgi:hypothetical protein
MPDNDDLSSFTDGFSEGMHVNPLPASEVRRRGDRMRRRNTTLATIGGVVAAAVFIGTPVALMGGGDDDNVRPAPPGPTPTVTDDAESPAWVTEIPDSFPLTADMTATGDPAEGDTDAYNLCVTSYPTSRGTADTQTWTYSDDGESSVQRTFQLWPDDAAANASLDALVKGVQDCPEQATTGGEDIIESKLIDFDNLGDRTVTFVQQVVADDGLVSQLSTVEATRVGNAVLVDSTYGSAGGDEAITIAVANLAGRSALTRDEMCIFSANPCQIAEASIIPTDVNPIPDDFPLAQGLDETAESDVTGPDFDVEAGRVFDVCGTEIWSSNAPVDRLAVRETGIEYLETRELDTYVTADEPIEHVTDVRDTVRDCDRIEGESYGYTVKVLEGPEGYDSVTWGAFADEGLDGGVYQITRVGSAVLVLYAAGEMSQSSLQEVADDMTQQTLELAPEMCVFTEDGC